MGDLLSLGVMGIRGSFSEEAAIEYARDKTSAGRSGSSSCSTREGAGAVEGGDVEIGIFAWRTHGGVAKRECTRCRPPVRVMDLFEIDVNHTL